jgi:hypothetical protein
MDAPSRAPAELSRTEQPHKELPRTEQPRTVSGKRPSEASLQRERDYMDWLSAQGVPEGDEQRDDSWSAFMAERRIHLEKERLRKLSERRKEQRCAAREAGHAAKRGRPTDPASRRQRKLAERAEDPAVRAERHRVREDAARAAELARVSARHKLHREARCQVMLASLPDEQRAEAERLYWESEQLKDAATVAKRQRDRKRKGRAADAEQTRHGRRLGR